MGSFSTQQTTLFKTAVLSLIQQITAKCCNFTEMQYEDQKIGEQFFSHSGFRKLYKKT